MSRFSAHNIWPPFSRRSLAARPPTLEAAARLRIKGAVTGLSEVYLSTTGPRPALPFAVVSPLAVSAPTVNNTTGYWEITTVQFTVFSADDVAAETLGRACMRALRARPKLKFDDGYHMAGWTGGTRKWPEPGIGPGGVKAFRFEFDWLFVVGRDDG